MSKFTSHITARRIRPYNNIKAKEQTGDELQKQLPLSKKCLKLIAENALRSPETNSLIPALLPCRRNIVCLVFVFRWRREREILQWSYVPFTERACFNCHVIFLCYKGNQQGVWGILGTTQREHSIYTANNYVISSAYLCTAAVSFSFAWGFTASCTRRCKAGFRRVQQVLINWDCKCLQTLQNRGRKTGQMAQESLQWAGSCLEPVSAYG